jgi:hypothetical protein
MILYYRIKKPKAVNEKILRKNILTMPQFINLMHLSNSNNKCYIRKIRNSFLKA